ncbi:MAG: prohibitin family protein [Ruminococcus sp.]|nr:prohibitin family protein [Ruminococcus sp.]
MKKGKVRTLVIVLAIVMIAAIVGFSAVTIVPAGNSGVIVTLGKVEDRALDSGLHFKVPFVQSVVMMNNKIQKCEVESNSVSKDLQTVSSSVAVNFHITSDSASEIYRTIGVQYQDTVLQPAIQEAVKSVSAQYTAEELITKRTAVGDEIASALTEKVSEYGIIIDKFNIVNFEFSEEFNIAIEQKQVAEQNYLKAQTEKEQQIMEAEADAKKQLIAAEAEAEAKLKKAEAEAEANEKINASLNGNILTYQQIQKWNGEYPNVVSSDSSVLIDVPVDENTSASTQTPAE